MKALTRDIAEKMVAEDPWFRSQSAIQLMPVIQPSDNVAISFIPETSIIVAELETVEYDNSPMLHCLLSDLYKKLSGELNEESKLTIEKLKLAKTGREYLLDYGKRSVAEITVSLPHQGRSLDENIKAATDYLESHNIAAYLQFNNNLRAYHHLEKSLELSGKNPTVFKQLIEPLAILYMTPFAIEASFKADCSQKSGYNLFEEVPVLIGMLNDKYNAAKMRVGKNN